MRRTRPKHDIALRLRAGELVEVRSEADILATLDEHGRLDGQPFMPEMLEFCGKQFKVYKRSDKTCDTIHNTGGRRLWNTVHLEELRCNGSAHGGCQARCLIFWKEAWLKRANPEASREAEEAPPVARSGAFGKAQLLTAASKIENGANGEKVIYSCQATEAFRASVALSWWDMRQYMRDIRYGQIGVLGLAAAIATRVFTKLLRIGIGYRALLWGYNQIQHSCGGTPYPNRAGTLEKTPTEQLNLEAGELVQVKSYHEILATLDKRNKNRGLLFDVEMAPFCDGKFRVLQRVEQIVNEKTGEMTKLPGTCIMLEGVICKSLYSDRRIACPRSIYSFWREIWLMRINEQKKESLPTA